MVSPKRIPTEVNCSFFSRMCNFFTNYISIFVVFSNTSINRSMNKFTVHFMFSYKPNLFWNTFNFMHWHCPNKQIKNKNYILNKSNPTKVFKIVKLGQHEKLDLLYIGTVDILKFSNQANSVSNSHEDIKNVTLSVILRRSVNIRKTNDCQSQFQLETA